ncbi:hypothetical protein [Blautia sp. OF09-25XD]|uniref:hypothetical protein n=1 Tax=Blautia sp. OF09-25XD TaxID=2292981 RepID=UPI0026D3C183|nr:hypothetical protein [Blautia sp. OF09-25XD]
MKDNKNIKVCLVGSSGGHLTHLYMLKPFWKDKNHFWVTFDKEDMESKIPHIFWMFLQLCLELLYVEVSLA